MTTTIPAKLLEPRTDIQNINNKHRRGAALSRAPSSPTNPLFGHWTQEPLTPRLCRARGWIHGLCRGADPLARLDSFRSQGVTGRQGGDAKAPRGGMTDSFPFEGWKGETHPRAALETRARAQASACGGGEPPSVFWAGRRT